jgi:hypothetical protein
MNWEPIKQPIKQLQQHFKLNAPVATSPFVLPTSVVEIQADFVAGLRLAGKGNGVGQRLRSIGVAGLNPDTVVPLVSGSNIANTADLACALQAISGTVANGRTRCGLLLPDAAVRVSLLSFETLPQNRKQAHALMRWRMKETLPFSLDEARISHQVVLRDAERIEVLAVAAKASVLAEYERALEQFYGRPALVLPATLALLPLLPEIDGAGQLLIHVCSGSITSAVTAGNRLRLWRSRQLGRLDSGELCRQAQCESARVMASCRDHLKVEISRVWLCARPRTGSEFSVELSQALDHPVEILEPGPEFAAALAGEDRSLFDSFGAPAAGLITNTL